MHSSTHAHGILIKPLNLPRKMMPRPATFLMNSAGGAWLPPSPSATRAPAAAAADTSRRGAGALRTGSSTLGAGTGRGAAHAGLGRA